MVPWLLGQMEPGFIFQRLYDTYTDRYFKKKLILFNIFIVEASSSLVFFLALSLFP